MGYSGYLPWTLKKGFRSGTNYAIEDTGLLFLFDIHNAQAVYGQEPKLFIPKKKQGKGRTPAIPRTEGMSVTVKAYKRKLDEKQWETIEVRDTAKGRLKLSIHVMQVWVWDSKEEHAGKTGSGNQPEQ